jgi:hypothetical protein
MVSLIHTFFLCNTPITVYDEADSEQFQNHTDTYLLTLQITNHKSQFQLSHVNELLIMEFVYISESKVHSISMNNLQQMI